MESLREDSSAIGVALSGYGTDDDIKRATMAGFSFHLTKPVDTQQLFDTIERIRGDRGRNYP